MSISSKLLNYATEDGGKLKLYTELDNSFVVGDIVYITGGYYDNTSSTSYFLNDPSSFSDISTTFGYQVLSIDKTNNGFTIDYNAIISFIVYPYGTALNKLGNPQDSTHKAYNTFSSDDIYKSVYVSTTKVIKADIKTSIINNGTFGNDYHSVTIGKPIVRNNTDNIINHIAGKNIIVNNSTIKSKTDTSNPPTKKVKVIEDTLFSLALVSIANNNDSYGYNLYDKISNNTPLIIENGDFSNPRSNYISISDSTIQKAKLGSKQPIYGVSLDNCTILSGSLYNTSNYSSNIVIDNSIIDSFINLNVISADWSATTCCIEFVVAYDDIANKLFVADSDIYISGFTEVSDPIANITKTNTTGKLKSASYTFADQSSATIKIKFDSFDSIPNWSTYIASNDISIFDFSNLCFHQIDNNLDDILSLTGNCTVSSYFNNPTQAYFANSNTFKLGMFKGVYFDQYTNILATSYALPVLLVDNFHQYYINNYNSTIINYAYINTGAISGIISNSYITGGVVYNSTINNTKINATSNTTYLYYVTLNDGSKVESDVIWNQVNINFTADQVVGTSIVSNAYLGDRKTKWKSGLSSIAPISSYAEQTNKISGYPANQYYNSQMKIVDNSTGSIPLKKSIFEVPSIYQLQPSVDTTKKMVILDRGSMYYSHLVWNTALFANRILFADVLDNDTTLSDIITDKTNNTTSGTYSDFTGVALPPSTNSQIVRVDDNFVQRDDYSLLNIYPLETTTQRNVSIDIYQDLTTPATFPNDITYPALTKMFLKVTNQVGVSYDNLYDNILTNTAVPNGTNTLFFRINNSFGTATKIPACFVEIERVIIEKKTLLDVPVSTTITNCNYFPTTTGNKYGYDNIINLSSYPTTFNLVDSNNSNITINMTANDKYVVSIEFWVTWYYKNESLSNNNNNPYVLRGREYAYRTKHILHQTFISSNETFHIIDDSSNTLVTSSGDSLIWV